MDRTSLRIRDLAKSLARVTISGPAQREEIFRKSIESIVRFALVEHECEQINGIRDDLARVDEIRERARGG